MHIAKVRIIRRAPLRRAITTDIRPRRGLAGQSLVEFALISITLLTVIFGIFEFGIAFWRSGTLDYATREGARALAVAASRVTADQDMIFAIGVAVKPMGVQNVIGIRVQKMIPNTVSSSSTQDVSGDSDYTPDPNHINYLANLRCDSNNAHNTRKPAKPANCTVDDPTNVNFNPNWVADYYKIDCAPPGYNPSNPSPCQGQASVASWEFRGVDPADSAALARLGVVNTYAAWPPRNQAAPTSRKDCIPTDVFRVDISIKHSWITGFIPGGPFMMTSSTRMRLEPAHYSTNLYSCP